MGGVHVPRLTATSPCDGLLPIRITALRLDGPPPGRMTLVAPLRGRAAEVSASLERSLGAALPAPGECIAIEGGRVLWFGAGKALVLGRTVTVEGAALTDQSDAWAGLRLSGTGTVDVLARLSPIVLRASAFPEGRTALTLVGHVPASITPVGQEAFYMLVPRSMARTVIRGLERAMSGVAVRNALCSDLRDREKREAEADAAH